MYYPTKQRMYKYLLDHNDGSEEAKFLINEMKTQLNYADVESYSVCIEDLEEYGTQAMRDNLNKKDGEPYTIDDCITVANALEDYIADDYGNDFHYAVEFNM